MKQILAFFFSFWFSIFMVGISAQSGLVAYYSFDTCDLSDESGTQMDGIPYGPLDCECGALASGMELGGGLDSIDFPANLTSIFNQDFTLSFYVKLNNLANRVDILSARSENCQLDSSFIIRYTEVTQQISVEFGEDFNNLIELFADVDLSNCWHHVIFSRNGLDYFLYYDGLLASEARAAKDLVIDPINVLSVSNSACNGILDDPLVGIIDEIRLYDRFLSPDELEPLSVMPDQIINQDTTIFLGDAIQILTGESCSQAPMWSPSTGVDNTSLLDPIITPTESTLYTLNLPGNPCSTSDQIQINVIDPDSLECSNLLLPNAFTPNGDNLNDQFGISNEFTIETLDRFEIFDRWGEKVFSTTNKNQKWDASFKGKVVNPAMFLYVVAYTCKGQDFTKTGSVSVLR